MTEWKEAKWQKQIAQHYIRYGPLFKGLCMGVDTEKEGKACSPTIWLQSEGLHGLRREGKTVKLSDIDTLYTWR